MVSTDIGSRKLCPTLQQCSDPTQGLALASSHTLLAFVLFLLQRAGPFATYSFNRFDRHRDGRSSRRAVLRLGEETRVTAHYLDNVRRAAGGG